MESKACAFALGCFLLVFVYGSAVFARITKQNTFDILRSKHSLTDAEAWWFIFGQQFCVVLVYTALEIREDLKLSEEENVNRGKGTTWPRARVHFHVYILYPIVWTLSFAGILAISPAGSLFSLNHGQESWLMTMMRMVTFLMLWEFIMYNLHRLAHANRWLYRIAHAEHHVAMDFPLGPHAAFLEKLANYATLFSAARTVNLSSGAFIFAINMLMCQCVMEHAYTSLTVPCIHTLLRFNTADEHEAHHQIVRGNYGYAFNWYDGLFGTTINEAKGRRTGTRRFL